MFRPFAPCPSPPHPIRSFLPRSSILLVSFFGPPCLVLRSSLPRSSVLLASFFSPPPFLSYSPPFRVLFSPVLFATVPEGLPSGLPSSILPSALPLCFLCHRARGFSLGSPCLRVLGFLPRVFSPLCPLVSPLFSLPLCPRGYPRVSLPLFFLLLSLSVSSATVPEGFPSGLLGPCL